MGARKKNKQLGEGFDAVTPGEVTPPLPTFLLSGAPATGKTWAALTFPNCFLIDCEGGAAQPEYQKRLDDGGGAYLGIEQGSQDFAGVLQAVKQLATTAHGFETLVIDSFTQLYTITAAIAEAEVGSDFGRDKKEANKPTRQLLRFLGQMNLTTIIVCHEKDKWGKNSKGEQSVVDVTFDGYDKLEYCLDLWLRAFRVGSQYFVEVKKSRLAGFPLELEPFEMTGEAFQERYGAPISGRFEPIQLATEEQLGELDHLLDVLQPTEDLVAKWTGIAGVANLSEMTAEQIQKCIEWTRAKAEEEMTVPAPPVAAT